MKHLAEFPMYTINVDGTIINLVTKKVLQSNNNQVRLTNHKTGVVKWFYIHRLVAFTYIDCGNTPINKLYVRHKDGNTSNNHINNLEVVDQRARVYSVGTNGQKRSQETKSKMSEAKKGLKHPKVKGVYIVDGQEFYSLNAVYAAVSGSRQTIKKRFADWHFPNYIFISK